ncbi:MAG: DUF2975 domain-containing protein [Prevotella sp.]|nr:DUF2975 domain-containing protein [Prevotella sp.]
MTTKGKIKRVRWMAALTLALLFLTLAEQPILPRLLPMWVSEVNPIISDRQAEWEETFRIIFILLYVILFVCLVVFFVRLFRGLKQGKIFVPGNARWLYIGALLPLPIILYRGMYLILYGCSSLSTTVFVSSLIQKLALFSTFTLMALLYDIATDVSEENQLTV